MSKKTETKEVTGTLSRKVALKKDQNLTDNIKDSAKKLSKVVTKTQKQSKDKFCFKKDEDSHLYLVPEKLAESFEKDCEQAYKTDEFDDFENKYGQYRCTHHMSCYVFENPTIKE